jgi:hypothetical protein
MSEGQTAKSDVPSSPEDGGNFRRSLQIDMKGLVGDAVGNVSWRLEICSSRDFSLQNNLPPRLRHLMLTYIILLDEYKPGES